MILNDCAVWPKSEKMAGFKTIYSRQSAVGSRSFKVEIISIVRVGRGAAS